MSRYLEIDDNEPAFLASNAGWSEFIAWVDGTKVPPSEIPNLSSLIESGTCGDPSACATELGELLDSHEPEQDVLTVAETLIELLADATAETDIAVVS